MPPGTSNQQLQQTATQQQQQQQQQAGTHSHKYDPADDSEPDPVDLRDSNQPVTAAPAGGSGQGVAGSGPGVTGGRLADAWQAPGSLFSLLAESAPQNSKLPPAAAAAERTRDKQRKEHKHKDKHGKKEKVCTTESILLASAQAQQHPLGHRQLPPAGSVGMAIGHLQAVLLQTFNCRWNWTLAKQLDVQHH
jgi:hypothetical protein